MERHCCGCAIFRISSKAFPLSICIPCSSIYLNSFYFYILTKFCKQNFLLPSGYHINSLFMNKTFQRIYQLLHWIWNYYFIIRGWWFCRSEKKRYEYQKSYLLLRHPTDSKTSSKFELESLILWKSLAWMLLFCSKLFPSKNWIKMELYLFWLVWVGGWYCCCGCPWICEGGGIVCFIGWNCNEGTGW